MKRALAQRAKESGHPNGLAPAVVASSGQPPQKLAKVDPTEDTHRLAAPSSLLSLSALPPVVVSMPSPRYAPKNSSSNLKTSMKRQRSTAGSDDEDDEDQSAFYLKHQNAALASELKQLQYQFCLMEKERDSRRKQCHAANQALQALESTWTQMEVALQLGQQPPEESLRELSSLNGTHLSEDMPRSTGIGECVELIGALLDALAALGGTNQGGDLNDMTRIAKAVSARATVLQRWIWSLLRKVTSGEEISNAIFDNAALEGQISILKSKCRDYEAQIAELVKSRDDAATSDRRVRRGLYRLSAGRMTLADVIKAVDDSDKDGTAALMALEEAIETPILTASTVAAVNDGDVVDSTHVAVLKKQLQDLEEIAAAREQQIEKLVSEREEHMKRINSLLLPNDTKRNPEEISDEEIKRSVLYSELSTKLLTSERQLQEMRTKLEKTKHEWAIARGDADFATKGLEENLAKYRKRWYELTGNEASENGGNNNAPDDAVVQAKRIIELEHKLNQALENVRQADTVRDSLDTAISMNEALTVKVDQMKAKHLAEIAGVGKNISPPLSALQSAAKETPNKDKEKIGMSTPLPDANKAEKMQREHRRMRKELEIARASKESARAKQERAEKERDSLMKTNLGLLQQSSEKDDMNAKSLSTILHLKNLTEKLTQEKDLLELQMKSSEQIQLAVRLATNARERVMEESLKEKNELQDLIDALNEDCESLKQIKEVAEGNLARKNAEMSTLEELAHKAKERSDELVLESTKQEEDKRALLEKLAIAQRDAVEASKQCATLRARQLAGAGSGDDGGSSVFTTDQLTTQISVLKSRLACPVCNHRDKKCILLRCRHMFCKQCIDETVRNRSRKCPACGQRFDTKDIGDVWL